MSQPATLGELIRERRLAHGMSLSQFASRMSVSTAEARRWERGEVEPIPLARASLGEVLELGPEVLDAVWPVVLGDDPAEADEPDFDPRQPEHADDTFLAAGGVVAASAGVGDDLPDGSVETKTADDTDEIAAALVIAEQPTQAIGAPFVVAAPVVTETAMLAVTEPEKPNRWNPFRYIYDPNRPWLYYIRTVLTVAVLVGLAFVLFRSLGLLLDALSELLDTISTDSDQIDSSIDAL